MANNPSQGEGPSNAYRSDREAALAHVDVLTQRNAALDAEVLSLRAEVTRLQAENDRLRPYAPSAPTPARSGRVVAVLAGLMFLLMTAVGFFMALRRSSEPPSTQPYAVPSSVRAPSAVPVPTSAAPPVTSAPVLPSSNNSPPT